MIPVSVDEKFVEDCVFEANTLTLCYHASNENFRMHESYARVYFVWEYD